MLIALVRYVFETTNPHLTAFVEAVLFVSFCKMVINSSLFLLNEGVGCYQKVFLYRYLPEHKAWSRGVLEHLTVDSSCWQFFWCFDYASPLSANEAHPC